jgi:hypothetical protein
MAITIVASASYGAWANTYSNPSISVSYQANDILIWMQMTNGGYANPTGFTNVFNPMTSALCLSYYKFTTSGTSYTVPVTWAGQADWVVIRGAGLLCTGTGTDGGEARTVTPVGGNPSSGFICTTTGSTSGTSTYTPQGYTYVPTNSWGATEYYTIAYKTFSTSVYLPAASTWNAARAWVLFSDGTGMSAPTLSNFTLTSDTAASTITLVGGDTFTNSGFIWSDVDSNPAFNVG